MKYGLFITKSGEKDVQGERLREGERMNDWVTGLEREIVEWSDWSRVISDNASLAHLHLNLLLH